MEEGWFLLHSVLLGIAVTFVYDCLRVWRRVIPHHIFWISIEDMLYWIFVACSIFYLLYYENNGAFRWFAILGAGAGMLLFQKTAGPVFIRYSSKLLLWFREKLLAMQRVLLRPVRHVGRKAAEKGQRGRRKAVQMFRIFKKRLTIRLRMARIILSQRYKRGQRGT